MRRNGNMKYLLQIYTAPSVLPRSEADGEALIAGYERFNQTIVDSGEFVTGEQVDRSQPAVSVQVRDGKITRNGGLVTETADNLGGFYVLDAQDITRAVELAAQIPNARTGTIEVRPLVSRTTPTTSG
jgi:hypothetical protein